MDFATASQQVAAAVRSSERILLIGHQRPDADALGSVAALSAWLKSQQKDHVVFTADRGDVPSLDFLTVGLPWAASVADVIARQPYQLVIVVDSGDLRYAGVEQLIEQLDPKPQLVNIDHHATNQKFGQINILDINAASTTEILHRFFKEVGYRVPPAVADMLLAGLVFDTYNFTNSNTSYSAMQATAKLLLDGAQLPRVSQAVLQNKPLPALKVWGKVLLRLRRDPKTGFATTVILQEDVEQLEKELPLPQIGMASDVTEGIANFLNNLTGVRAALVLRELPGGKIKGSFRTNDDLLDVAELAKMMGGGGHRKAAGFTINGQLEQQQDGSWKIV